MDVSSDLNFYLLSNETKSVGSFTDMPYELMEKILLSVKSKNCHLCRRRCCALFPLVLVCKQFAAVLDDYSPFWKSLFLSQFGRLPVENENFEQFGQTWKWIYVTFQIIRGDEWPARLVGLRAHESQEATTIERGTFVQGQLSGYGTRLVYARLARQQQAWRVDSLYEGCWQQSRRSGAGRQIAQVVTDDNISFVHCYRGAFLDDRFHGFAIRDIYEMVRYADDMQREPRQIGATICSLDEHSEEFYMAPAFVGLHAREKNSIHLLTYRGHFYNGEYMSRLEGKNHEDGRPMCSHLRLYSMFIFHWNDASCKVRDQTWNDTAHFVDASKAPFAPLSRMLHEYTYANGDGFTFYVDGEDRIVVDTFTCSDTCEDKSFRGLSFSQGQCQFEVVSMDDSGYGTDLGPIVKLSDSVLVPRAFLREQSIQFMKYVRAGHVGWPSRFSTQPEYISLFSIDKPNN